MRLNIIGGLLISLLASACASVQDEAVTSAPAKMDIAVIAAAGHSQSPQPLAVDSGRVQLNVKGGSFSYLESRSEKEQSYLLVLDHVNKHPQWAAVQILCVKGAVPGKMACLKVTHSAPDSNLLRIAITTGTDRKVEQTTRLDGEYSLGQEIPIKITINPRDVEFAVNGKPVFAQPIDFATDNIRLGCSSAECIFTLL